MSVCVCVCACVCACVRAPIGVAKQEPPCMVRTEVRCRQQPLPAAPGAPRRERRTLPPRRAPPPHLRRARPVGDLGRRPRAAQLGLELRHLVAVQWLLAHLGGEARRAGSGTVWRLSSGAHGRSARRVQDAPRTRASGVCHKVGAGAMSPPSFFWSAARSAAGPQSPATRPRRGTRRPRAPGPRTFGVTARRPRPCRSRPKWYRLKSSYSALERGDSMPWR
jgi:hypothetical protein